MAEEKKTSAELAREKRKARIEKAANDKKIKEEKKANLTPAQKRLKVIIPIVVIALAIAISLIIFFGVPQRLTTAVKSDAGNISRAELEFYEKYFYNYYYQTASQYEAYGEGIGAMYTGFDITKTPADQAYPVQEGEELPEEVGENPTWADMFEYIALEQTKQYKAVCAAAKDAKFELTADQNKEIDEIVEELRTSASQNDYGLGAYLKAQYGRGMNEKLFRKILVEQYTFDSFLDSKSQEFTDAVTEDEINEYYKNNENDFKELKLRIMEFSSTAATNDDEDDTKTDEQLAAETKKNNDKTMKEANAFFNKVNSSNFISLATPYFKDDYANAVEYYGEDNCPSLSEYIDSSTIQSFNYTDIKDNEYFGEDLAKWAYNSARKAGDKYSKLIKTDNEDGSVTYNVIILSSLPKRDNTYTPVAVRHILIGLEYTEDVTDEDGNTTSESKTRSLTDAKKIANDLLAEWKKGDTTEDTFATLASENSDDTGSIDNGGLYDDITADSSYVQEFKDWALSKDRKVGDVGIIETEYGVHVMYMSNIPKRQAWQASIASVIAETNYAEYTDEIIDKAKFTIKQKTVDKVTKKLNDFATSIISNAKTSASTSTDTSADVSVAE